MYFVVAYVAVIARSAQKKKLGCHSLPLAPRRAAEETDAFKKNTYNRSYKKQYLRFALT